MNNPVNFELAKLLKEKGWDKPIDSRWFFDTEHFSYKLSLKGAIKWNPKAENSYPAPTIAEVVMWLYEKHKIWLNVGWENSAFTCRIQSCTSRYNNLYNILTYLNSPIKAYEAAIDYTLKNLI